MSENRKIFGTDGVRGVANVEPVTAETALKLGRAAAHVFMQAHFRKEDFNRAIILAISEVGKVLAAHFPRTGDTINELPDEIVQG